MIDHQPLVNEEELREEEELQDPEGPRRLRVAETVLSRRTNQVALVLERCFNKYVRLFSSHVHRPFGTHGRKLV